MTTLASTSSVIRDPRFRRSATRAIGLVLVGNLLVWVVAGLLLGDPIQIVEPGAGSTAPLGVGPVVLASVVPAAIGILFVGLAAGMGRARLSAVVVAATTIASLAIPLTLDVGAGSKLALSLMHLVSGGIITVLALRAADALPIGERDSIDAASR